MRELWKKIKRPIGSWHNQPAGLVLTKSLLSLLACFSVAYVLNNPTTAFQTGITTMLSLKEDRPGKVKRAVNRMIGTVVAGLTAYGFVLFVTRVIRVAHGEYLYYVLNAFTLVLLIAIFLLIGKANAIIPGVIVFHLTTHLASAVADPFPYVLQRSADTLIGIAVAMFVNWLPPLNKIFSFSFPRLTKLD